MADRIQGAQEDILKLTNGMKFSRNVVCVDITSSNCQDLSLIDLPGLIEAADTQEEEKYIDLILALVRDYLSQENTSMYFKIVMSRSPCFPFQSLNFSSL